MPEPGFNDCLGGLPSVAAQESLSKRAWNSGEKWVVSRFAHHQDKAKAKAVDNSVEFLTMLGKRVTDLENEIRYPKSSCPPLRKHPEFSVVLQKAMLSAAQTENQNKTRHLVSASGRTDSGVT